MPIQKTEIGVQFHYTDPGRLYENGVVFRELARFNARMDGYTNGEDYEHFELITRLPIVAELLVKIALDSPEINHINVRRISEEAEAEDR